jgi:hypothetical protein
MRVGLEKSGCAETRSCQGKGQSPTPARRVVDQASVVKPNGARLRALHHVTIGTGSTDPNGKGASTTTTVARRNEANTSRIDFRNRPRTASSARLPNINRIHRLQKASAKGHLRRVGPRAIRQCGRWYSSRTIIDIRGQPLGLPEYVSYADTPSAIGAASCAPLRLL